MDSRQKFLNEFLGALGAREVHYLEVTPEFVSGTVVYDPNDPEEKQEFCWSIGPRDAPSPEAARLVAVIRSDQLLSTDKLRVSREDLLVRFNACQGQKYSLDQFSVVLEELLQIEVPMLDNGVKSDCYFIHE